MLARQEPSIIWCAIQPQHFFQALRKSSLEVTRIQTLTGLRSHHHKSTTKGPESEATDVTERAEYQNKKDGFIGKI